MKIILKKEQITERVEYLGAKISADYMDKNPVLIGCLKGCVVFLADLMREITIPYTVEFVRTSTYGESRTSSGIVQAEFFDLNVRGRHTVIVEDIVDTGLTLSYLITTLTKQDPLSLKVCAFLVKPGAYDAPVTIDYKGFDVPDEFVVGYGLDWNEQYRGIPYLAVVDEKSL